MGGLKKGNKSSGKGKGKGPKGDGRRDARKLSQDDTQRVDHLLPLQERVAAVKPFWETLSQEERGKILTVTVDELEQRAAELAERHRKQAAAEEQMYPGETLAFDLEPSIEELLQQGISRLHEKPTWKLWQWLPDEKEFLEADSFRSHIENERIEQPLRALLPKEEGKPVEKPAEAALRLRMSDLLQRIHQHNRQLQEEPPSNGSKRSKTARATPDQMGAAMRDSNIELINIMMESLEQEHEFLYHAVLFPITSCICELLEEGQRESTCLDLCYEDLEKLHPDEVARICEWLTEKVDGFSSKIKPEAKDVEEEEEEEGIGDVDLFSLSEDRKRLLVNAKWLQHLQERVLGDDGQPRKMKEGEDPFHMGLVLEWVYGTIVSTAEKARDGAKRTLGTRPPTATTAHDQLTQALREQQSWEKRAKDAKDLLQRMLKSRVHIGELGRDHDVRPAPTRTGPSNDGPAEPSELPDSVIVSMLQREVLLTEAKLHALDYELVTSERKLRQLRSQLRQGEPEFERLKRELEEVKNQPRGLEGTFRSAAEMERHRAQMADAAIEEQLEVQTAFREHGARLQGIYDKRQRTEMEIARKEQELKQLKGWRQTVQSLIDRFEEHLASAAQAEENGDAHASKDDAAASEDATASHHQTLEAAATRTPSGQDAQLSKLRTHFQKDVRRQLYGDEDDRTFFDWIRTELRAVEKKLDDGRAVLHHLEMFLVNVACNDPGAAIGASLVLPLLQDRLDARTLEFAAQRAAAAEEAIIKMEEEKAERTRQERERRQKVKQKAKDKVRSEKERIIAERDAKLEAERAVLEESKRALVQKEELLRQQKLEEMEKRREVEEAEMEARRKELLSEEDGYWRQRMAQEARQQALQEGAIIRPNAQADDEPSVSSASDNTTWKDDDDGFQDTSKGPRRSRVQKNGPRRSEPDFDAERPVNGFMRPNGRVEETRLQRHGKDSEAYREHSFHRERPRPHVHEGRTLPLRDPNRMSPAYSRDSAEKARSGRTSPQMSNETPTARRSPTPAMQPLSEAALSPKSSSPGERKSDSPDAAKSVDAGEHSPVPTGASPQLTASATGDSSRATDAWPAKEAEPTPRSDGQASAEPLIAAPREPTAVAEGRHNLSSETSPGPSEDLYRVQNSHGPPLATPSPAVPSQEDHVEPQLQAEESAQQRAGPAPGPSELAPGTPAQQAPQLPLLAPMLSLPDGSHPPGGQPQPPAGGVIFMQNAHMPVQRNAVPRMLPVPGPLGGPPPHQHIEMGFPRQGPTMRRDVPSPFAGPHGNLAPQGIPNGHVPMQQRRPQIAPPREPGMHSPVFVRGAGRGQPPPPGSGPQAFPQAFANGPGTPHPVESADVGPGHGMMGSPPYITPGSQAASGPQGSGPPVMYGGLQAPPGHQHKLNGSQQMPQHVFVGNMVNSPFSIMPMPQMQLMNGPSGTPNGPMHPSQASSQHPGSMYPMPNGSPRGLPMPLRIYTHPSHPQHQLPAMQRAAGGTTLRASAPSFVPGGIRPSSGQQSMSRRPISEHRRKSEDRSSHGHLPRRSSSGALSGAGRLASEQASGREPESDQQHPAFHVRSDLQAVQSAPSMPHRIETDPPTVMASPPAAGGHDAQPSGAASSADRGARQQEGTSRRQDSAVSSGLQAEPTVLLSRLKDSESAQQDIMPENSLPEALGQSPAPSPTAAIQAQQTGHPPPKWSTVAAMDRQATNSQAGTSSAAPIKKSSSAEAFPSNPSSGKDAAKRSPQNAQNAATIRKSGSGSQLNPRPSASSRTAGDKRKVTRAGGVTWEGLQGDLHRLRLVRGLSNEAGRNNCFLNVIIQSLWHLRSFREALLSLPMQSLEARGPPAEDLRVLRALLNIFTAFSQPRDELLVPDTVEEPPSRSDVAGGGEEAGAKRAKREGQEDAAAAKVSNSWTVSPAELREALSVVSRDALRFDLTDMHDAAEVLDKIFSSLQRAELGLVPEGEQDAALPIRVRLPASGPAGSPQQSCLPVSRRRSLSLVENLFGLDVQVPSPGEDDEEDSQTVKRSKGTGGAVVGRWQEAPGRPSKGQGGSPKATKPTAAKKAKDPSVVEMLQFIKLYHLVPAQGLKVAYDVLIGSTFEELLRQADVAEVLAQGTTGSNHTPSSRAAKTSDIVLLKRPRVFNLAIGWESAQAPAEVINATIEALAPHLDPVGVFKSAPKGPRYMLRCIVCYFGHHYKAYALSEELEEWILLDDTTISHVGAWKDVKAALRASRLQPNLLFYEQEL